MTWPSACGGRWVEEGRDRSTWFFDGTFWETYCFPIPTTCGQTRSPGSVRFLSIQIYLSPPVHDDDDDDYGDDDQWQVIGACALIKSQQ